MRSERADYSFVRRPTWIAGHLLALVAIVSFVQLGAWQLRRLDERQALNAMVTDRLARDHRPLATLIELHGNDPAELAWRRVEVSGSYDTGEEVIVQGRSLDGRSGHHVATPLVTDGDRAVLVNRGWVPIDVEGPPVVGAAPPAGPVTIRGVIRESQVRVAIGPSDEGSAPSGRVAAIDVTELQLRSDHDLFGFYVDLEAQLPPQAAEVPAVVAIPEFGTGPHLSYAIQWFIFAALVTIGYPVLLYRTARPRAAEDRGAG